MVGALVATVASAAGPGGKAADLVAAGGTVNLAAFDAYLRGRALYDLAADEASEAAALAQFDAAIAADPAYASAHAARARSLTTHAYRRLIDECRLTQDEVGQKVGKDRSTVTNFLRLLKLPEKVREGLRQGRLTMGHARALLSLENERDQLKLYDQIVMGGVNVRSVERTTRARKARPAKHTTHGTGIHSVEEQLKRMLGTKVKVHAKSGGRGEIVIQYFSADDLERILELILEKRHR